MKKYRLAIVGLGRMASTIDQEVINYPPVKLPYSVAASCQETDRIELVAGADILLEKRSAFSNKWGIHALYQDYLKTPVLRNTPFSRHASRTLSASSIEQAIAFSK